jgi:hypothetical protein
MGDGALPWQPAHHLALVCSCPAGVVNVQGLPALASPGEGGQRLVLGWLVPLWLLTLWFTGYTLTCVAQLLVKQERKRTMRMVSGAMLCKIRRNMVGSSWPSRLLFFCCAEQCSAVRANQ